MHSSSQDIRRVLSAPGPGWELRTRAPEKLERASRLRSGHVPRAHTVPPWRNCFWRGTAVPAATSPGGRPRPVRDPRLRDDAAADAGRAGRAALPRVARTVADGRGARRRLGGGRHPRLAGLGYNRRALALHRAAAVVAAEGWPDDLTELPGRRPVHGRRDPQLRVGENVLPGTSTSTASSAAPATASPAQPRRRSWNSAPPSAWRASRAVSMCPLADVCPSAERATSRSRKQGPFEGSFGNGGRRRSGSSPSSLPTRDELDAEAVDGARSRRARRPRR